MKSAVRFSLSAALLAASALFAPASAQVTVGTAEPGTGNCYPIGCNEGLTRYQQVYSSTAFAGVTSISAFTYFHTQYQPGIGFYSAGTYNFSFGYTSMAVNGLSGNLNANVTSPQTLFATLIIAPGTSSAPSTFTVNGNAAFNYDPTLGNLLMDVTIDNVVSQNSTYLDVDESGSSTSRAFGMGGDGTADASGLVTRFETGTTTVTPEPASFAMVGVGMLGLGLIARRRKSRSN